MPKQFDGAACALCPSETSTRNGEHVLPLWLIRRYFPPSDGPYTWWRNNEPVLRRDGQIREDSSFGSEKLPMGRLCNTELNRRFEQRTKTLIRRVLDSDGDAALDAADASRVGLWFLKTWLLMTHPSVVHSGPDTATRPWSSAPALYDWMVRNAAPPDGLSLWITKRDDRDGLTGPDRHIPLPTVTVDGSTVQFLSRRFGIKWLDVSLVYHPGWAIQHPLELEGSAVRLWPREPAEEVDFGQLPAFSDDGFSWLQGPRIHFASGTYDPSSLPPLSIEIDPLFRLPGVTAMFG